MSGLLKYYDDGEWKPVGQQDIETLNGFYANAEPTPHQILPLDENGKFPASTEMVKGYATFQGYRNSNQTHNTTTPWPCAYTVRSGDDTITTTGRPLLVVGTLPMYTSAGTASLWAKIGDNNYFLSRTNQTSIVFNSGSTIVTLPAGTYTIDLAISSQASGQITTFPSYNAATLTVVEI